MGAYSVTFKPSVEKDLRRLPASVVSRILVRIEALANAPLSASAVKLAGAEKLFRVRVGDYRIIYEINQKAHSVVIHYIRPRRDAYRRLS